MATLFSLRRALLVFSLAHAAFTNAADAELTAGMYRIEAEIAHTYAGREQGLMGRTAMAEGRGMVFVFPADGLHCMWMANTLIPLSVAFVDAKGVITNIEDMQPHTRDSHCASQPARFALEMNLGWFQRRGVKAGARLGGMDTLPPPR